MPVQDSVGQKYDPRSKSGDGVRNEDMTLGSTLAITDNRKPHDVNRLHLPGTQSECPESNVEDCSEANKSQHEASRRQSTAVPTSSGSRPHVDGTQDAKDSSPHASTQSSPIPLVESPGKEKKVPSDKAIHSIDSNQPVPSTAVGEALIIPNGSAIVASAGVSGWSHQALAPHKVEVENQSQEDEWQDMPSYAPYDLYDDDGKLIAREEHESDDEGNAYAGLGGAGKGYTRVQVDEDARSATSLDDNTSYLFKHKGTDVAEEDEEQRDPLAQMQATKNLLTEGQRIAYVGVTRLAMIQMVQDLDNMEKTKNTKKEYKVAMESMKMWSQQMMLRLYAHMEINPSGIQSSFLDLFNLINDLQSRS